MCHTPPCGISSVNILRFNHPTPVFVLQKTTQKSDPVILRFFLMGIFFFVLLRVRTQVRGPGVPANQTEHRTVLNIDVAPTIVDIATGSIPDDMNGMSFAAYLYGQVTNNAVDWVNGLNVGNVPSAETTAG